jgi:tRNA modification GTPase
VLAIHDLIVAPATVAGGGSRAVVRLSGEGLTPLLAALCTPEVGVWPAEGSPPRLVQARFAETLAADWGSVPVEILHWPGPAGPTGGPLAEMQLPASQPLVDAVVAAACARGARLARGGEFSLRAFLAGRIDLVQAEAVLAVVDAKTPDDLSHALDALAGGIGRELRGLCETLLDLTADVEAAIDFADERTPDAVPAADAALWEALDERLADVAARLAAADERLARRDVSAAAGLPMVVLVGAPNIGKSSLFNALVGRDAALVADEAGTTRDWIAARLDSAPTEPACLVVDVAGLDEGATAMPLPAAAERARAEIARADVVVACIDAGTLAAQGGIAGAAPSIALPHLPAVPRIDVVTRCDLAAAPPSAALATSSRRGTGIAALRAAILRAVASLPGGGSPATRALRAGMADARDAIVAARLAAASGPAGGPDDEAVVAGLLRRAAAALAAVTGAEIGTDIIDRIFSRHCIGK